MRPAAVSSLPCATNSRARVQRAILADPNALLEWPKVTEAARLPGRGLGPYPTNLRVQDAQLRTHVSILLKTLNCGRRASRVPQFYTLIRLRQARPVWSRHGAPDVAGPPTRRGRGARQAELHRRRRPADPQRQFGHRQRPRLCGRQTATVQTYSSIASKIAQWQPSVGYDAGQGGLRS